MYIHLKDMHYITSMEKFTGRRRENYLSLIHKVISDEGTLGIPEVIAVVLLVNVDFVKKLVPNLEQMYFLPEADSDMEKI